LGEIGESFGNANVAVENNFLRKYMKVKEERKKCYNFLRSLIRAEERVEGTINSIHLKHKAFRKFG
jgi:hypothetical protein